MKTHIIWLCISTVALLVGMQLAKTETRVVEKPVEIVKIKEVPVDRPMDGSRNAPKQPPASEVGFENALDTWIGKVRRLSAYLKQHPGKRIPQMDLLTDEEWLDVTKGKLESDADFREALGKLRGLARQKVAKEIGAGIKSIMSSNGGRVPTDPLELLSHLPPGFNPEILKQMSVNPTGRIEGLNVNPPQQFVLLDNPVDLFDATFFYSAQGNPGSRSAAAPGQQAIKLAISDITRTNGNAPTSASQLLQYPGIDRIAPQIRDEIFKALTSKPDF